MTVKINLTSAGSNISVLDIYSDSDNFTTPIYSDVAVADLLIGDNFIVPDDATIVRVQAVEECVNYLDITLSV